MSHKNYLLYIPDAESREAARAALAKKYPHENATYALNGAPILCLKVESDIALYEVMQIAGLNDEKEVSGFIQDMSSEQNGWFNKSFWDWLSSSIRREG